MLTVGSLFAGIGGFDLGLERAGMQVKWQVEIDPYCLKVLEKHWPHVRRYTDIKQVDWSGVESVDLVCGGFPCQDLSVAGKRAGIGGARSGLWSEYVRCLRALRPRYVLVENVPGLLTNAAMGRVLGDLADCGYDAEWQIISAAAVGAPHLRKRVWIVAYPKCNTRYQRPVLGSNGWSHEAEQTGMGVQGCSVAHSESRESRQSSEPERRQDTCGGSEEINLANAARFLKGRQEQRPIGERIRESSQQVTLSDTDESRLQGRDSQKLPERAGQWIARPSNPFLADTVFQQRHRWSDGIGWWEREPEETLRTLGGRRRQEDGLSIPESLLGRVAHGIPFRVDRLRGLGNAVVPQCVEWIGRRILECHLAHIQERG